MTDVALTVGASPKPELDHPIAPTTAILFVSILLAGILYAGLNEGRVVLRVDRILDDVLRGIHRGTAHHDRHLVGEGWNRREGSESKIGGA